MVSALKTPPILIPDPARWDEPAYRQKITALDKGNMRRIARSALKWDLYDKPREQSWNAAADLIEQPPELIRGMKVRQLLVACRGLGPVRADRLLLIARIRPYTRLENLSERQRGEIVAWLRKYAKPLALGKNRRD